MTSGCVVAPLAGMAAQPILSFVTSSVKEGETDAKGPISVDQLLANARGDAPANRGMSPEAKAIAAAMAADAEPKKKAAKGAISVAELLNQARATGDAEAAPPSAKAGAAAPVGKSDATGMDIPLAATLKDGAAFLRMQMKLNGWAVSAKTVHVALGVGDGAANAADMIANMERLRMFCAKLANRCAAENATLQPGLNSGWVRLSPAKGGDNA